MSRHYPTSRADSIAQDIARQKNAEFLAKQSRPLVSDSTIASMKALAARDAEFLAKRGADLTRMEAHRNQASEKYFRRLEDFGVQVSAAAAFDAGYAAAWNDRAETKS